ncbi:MAG: ROK family protein [Armatimonadota bacterium]
MPNGMKLIEPSIKPPLDPDFKPAVLANHAFLAEVQASGSARPVKIAVEREDGVTSVYETQIFEADAGHDDENFMFVERIVKFLLWQRGGWKIVIGGAPEIGQRIKDAYAPGGEREFDADLMGGVYDKEFTVEVVSLDEVPAAKKKAISIGGHLEGCRVGFDLGASDRKSAAVIDGEVVYSDEIEWDPKNQEDPQYHWDGVMESIQLAVDKMPRVDAIGGSAAGIYVDNRAKVASLFRGIPDDQFKEKIEDMFIRMGEEFGCPLVVVNDGDVTALAAGMDLEDDSILGIAMGSSEAGGYLNNEGRINGWLNELAFAPLDFNPDGPVDEWSGDQGVGAQYFNQVGVARMCPRAGLGEEDGIEEDMDLPQLLKVVQKLHLDGDERAEKVLATIGVWLGYTLAHYADFYDLKHVLILGRVTSGEGGPTMLREARRVLEQEFPELADQIELHLPDETSRRHGQAIAAASLPEIE